MGKLASDKRSGRGGQRWMEQTKIVNNVTTARMPMTKCYVQGISNVGETYQTLAEVTSSHAVPGSTNCNVPTKNSVSAPSLVLESSASFTVPVVERPHAPPAPAAPRLHTCSCRWVRRPDKGKNTPVYEKICHCKRDRQQRREKSYKQQITGTSKSCLKKTCKKERSVPSMPPTTHTDAGVQLLYYRNKLTATEQLVEKKDEIIRLQNKSLALAEKRLATLTAARVELRRSHGPTPHSAPAPTHYPSPTHSPAPTHSPSPTHSPGREVHSTYRAKTFHDCPMQSKQQQESLVQTLQDNLSVMEELYRESFYEAAKQEDVIESLRLSCLELRDLEASKADEVGRLQNVLNNQQWTIEQCQRMAAEVERLKSEIYNFVNSSNNDSGVWEGEETSAPEIKEDLQDITSQLLKLRDILTDNSSSADDENLKLKEKNMQLQSQISQLQSHIGRLQTALTTQDPECGSLPTHHDTTPASPVRGRQVKSKSSLRAGSKSGRPRTCTQCQHMNKQPASVHSSVHSGKSHTTTAMRTRTDDPHIQEQDEEASPRSVSSQARCCSACTTSKRVAGAEPLTLLQVQLTSAQQRSAALCQEARRALCRVRKWAQRMRIRLKERESEIERQKQEIEELRKYINKLKDSSEKPLPESKALTERNALKKQTLEDEEEHCRELRKEIEELKQPMQAEQQDDEDYDVDDICEEEEAKPEPCPIKCKSAFRQPPDVTERDKNFRHKCRPRPHCREEEPKGTHKLEHKNIELESSCYEINPGEIAEVNAPSGVKVLVKCKNCERRNAEETQNQEIQTQTEEPRVTTYQEDMSCNEELCPKPKRTDDKHCNEELCLMPDKKKEVKKPPRSPPSCAPCIRCPCSSKDTIVCHSNESLRSLRFKESPEIVCCPKDECPSPERQLSVISRPRDLIKVPVTLKCRQPRTTTSVVPNRCEPTSQQTKVKRKDKKKLKLPKLDIKSSKKLLKDSRKRKDNKEEAKKQCCCTGPCRCRCSTQAWKLEACSSRCSHCSRCSRGSASSLASQEDPRANTVSSVDSYHSLLMGHLKKKFPFLAHRWGRCEASVQQPLRSDAGTSRSRPFEELIGVERKSPRPQPAPSKTLTSIGKNSQPRCLPLVEQEPPRLED